MLDCNAVDGQVDQATYSHIIKMWVKDVRGRTTHSLSPPPSPPLEVSQHVWSFIYTRPLIWIGVHVT